MLSELKQCRTCKEHKPLEDFAPRTDVPGMRMGLCKVCLFKTRARQRGTQAAIEFWKDEPPAAYNPTEHRTHIKALLKHPRVRVSEELTAWELLDVTS